MSLRDWLENHWLNEHTSSPEETAGFFEAIERDLNDCRAEGISLDWRLTIAYMAALRAATVALAATGYRATREQHHYRVIQSLRFTIGANDDLIDELDQFRKKRNITSYEGIGAVSDYEAEQMSELAEHLRDSVLEWIRKTHPDLMVS